jgi:hypothetical protein
VSYTKPGFIGFESTTLLFLVDPAHYTQYAAGNTNANTMAGDILKSYLIESVAKSVFNRTTQRLATVTGYYETNGLILTAALELEGAAQTKDVVENFKAGRNLVTKSKVKDWIEKVPQKNPNYFDLDYEDFGTTLSNRNVVVGDPGKKPTMTFLQSRFNCVFLKHRYHTVSARGLCIRRW